MIDERKTSEIFSFSFDRRDTKFFIEGRFLDFSISEEQLLIRNLLSSKEFKRGWNDSILLRFEKVSYQIFALESFLRSKGWNFTKGGERFFSRFEELKEGRGETREIRDAYLIAIVVS